MHGLVLCETSFITSFIVTKNVRNETLINVQPHAAVARSIPLRFTDLYYARGAQRVLLMRVRGATSQLDLPSLTPLSVVGCG